MCCFGRCRGREHARGDVDARPNADQIFRRPPNGARCGVFLDETQRIYGPIFNIWVPVECFGAGEEDERGEGR